MYNITIAHHNIRSLNDKIHELKSFIDTNQAGIITLNETYKIKPNTNIKNYTITQPINNIGQGVAIIHKNNLNIYILPPIATSIPTKNLQHTILIHTPTDSIQIATLYCPRGKPSTEILKTIMTRHDKTIITGDFNCKHVDFDHDKNDQGGNTLVDITNQYKYTKLNDNQPTYTNDRTGKEDVKDLMFSSPQMTSTFDEFWVDEDLGHNIIIGTFKHKNISYKPPPKLIHLCHKANWTIINNNITQVMNTIQINHKSSQQDIDKYITKLTTTIQDNIKHNVKTIQIQPDRIGLPQHTLKLIKEKQNIRKLYQRTRQRIYKTQYNQLNKQIKLQIKAQKRNNWQKKCNDLELTDNQENTWPQLKRLLGLKPPPTKFPTLITKNETTDKKMKSTTPQQKVDTLTTTFQNIFTHETSKPHFNEKHKKRRDTEIAIYKIMNIINPLKEITPNYTETEHTITKENISHTIDKLNVKKASGPDKISNKLIQYLKPSLINILHQLYKISWHKGYHSINWKTPITLLFNKPDKPKSNPLNCRPISLINNLSKILEKIIKNKLTNWAESNNKINDEQAGFRENKSTQDKIFQLTQTAMHARNMKRFSAAIFMDVEKAFDKVWHAGLIHTLINMDLPNIFDRYINSFISHRHFYFRIENQESPKIKMNL